jgi:hypothetical protein
MRTLATGWAVYTTWRGPVFAANFQELIAGPTSPCFLDLFSTYWKTRQVYEVRTHPHIYIDTILILALIEKIGYRFHTEQHWAARFFVPVLATPQGNTKNQISIYISSLVYRCTMLNRSNALAHLYTSCVSKRYASSHLDYLYQIFIRYTSSSSWLSCPSSTLKYLS